MNKFKQTVWLSVYTYVVGFAYLLVVQLNVVDKGYTQWSTDQGRFLLIPFIVCILYASIMLALTLINDTEYIIADEPDDISLSTVYYMDKHESVARVMEKHS